MHIFWDNIWKFPKFILSVFLGFFLTAAYPFLQLSKSRKILYVIMIIVAVNLYLLYIILKYMLGYT
uniref:Uncharacterized protein ycf33 n=1 Tax=Hommersandiophycus borowitzkae TaxID=268573 RepID=A0A1G4NUA0_9FLOR|nr:Hypothetical protein ycf33 [Hommersandiophycus borowitzkae]SCW22240.1 Hypothetical protein ycf33 [Hommersandiophycus borowitzkae]